MARSCTMTPLSMKAVPEIVEEANEQRKASCIQQEQFLATDSDEVAELQKLEKTDGYKIQIVWRNVALFVALHIGALIGLYQFIFIAKWATVGFAVFLVIGGALGVTAGAHRLWTHRSYKARWPARLILMLANCVALQNDVIEWARDHRCHHKWTDTHADPHNSNRGFFFSHIGWLAVRKHPEVRRHGEKLDLSDLYADPLLRFQRRFYVPLVLLFCFIMPTAIPVYAWGENALVSFYVCAIFRLCYTLNGTWLINSAAHQFGYKPYDPNISSTDTLWLSTLGLGEGGHNYHHTFPQDYRTSEYILGCNLTKMVIDGFAALGWVYDRKIVPQEIIEKQKEKHIKNH